MGEGGVGMGVWECLGPWVKGFRGWMCVSIRGHGWNGLGVGVCVWTRGEGGVGMGVWECLGPWVKGFRGWMCVSIRGHGWNGLGVGVYVWAMGEGSVGMGVWECLGPWVKGFRGWMCVSIRGHGWNGLGVGVYVWAMGEGGVGMGVWECLGPWVKGFRGWMCVSIRGHGWNGLGMDICVWALASTSCPYPPPHPHICFVLFNGLNADMNHDSEPRHLNQANHDIWTTMKLRLSAGVVGGGNALFQRILPGYQPRKWPKIAVLGLMLVSQVTCLVAGFEKSVKIAVLGLIRVSQENWRTFFVILVKYFIILSNLEAFSR